MQIMNYSYALTKHIPEIHAALISDIVTSQTDYDLSQVRVIEVKAQ
mgnify:FL=1